MPSKRKPKLTEELFPELRRQPWPKSRGIRPSDGEIAIALRATKGRYGIAALRLQCSERSLRRWTAENPELEAIVNEERELLIDEAELVIDQILADPRHPRNFDAARFVCERLGRNRGFGMRIEHMNKVEVSSRFQIPEMHEREFVPELWDTDEAHRFKELMEIPTHKLSHNQLAELQDLRRKATQVIEIKTLPAPDNEAA